MTAKPLFDDTPDIYGQIHPNETPELVDQKLKDFDVQVSERIKSNSSGEENQCVIQAMEKCPELLTSGFKLMFLRCEVFHTELAVIRYFKYWHKRVEIFGDERAFQPLTLDKAMSEDRIALEIGYLRLIPGATDPMGRAIFFSDPSLQDRTKYTRISLTRASWYVVHAALESETAQKHGVVVIGDPSRAQFSQFDRKLSKVMLPVMQVMPVRLSGYHVCKPPAFAAIVVPIVKFFLSDRIKKRIHFHVGGNERVLKSLERFGLDKSVVPVELGGDVKLDHMSWLEKRRSMGL